MYLEMNHTDFFISKDKKSGKINFQMDDCQAQLSVKETKELIETLKRVVKE